MEDSAHHVLIEEVRDAVDALVDIIRTYKSKGRVSQVMMSTLFKRRQDEAEAVIDAAICRLQVGASTILYFGNTDGDVNNSKSLFTRAVGVLSHLLYILTSTNENR